MATQKGACAGGCSFYFYPEADKGVLGHFYRPAYHIAGNPRLIFDVGANIGSETFRFRHFHPSAQIVAIEASSRNCKILRKNFDSDPKTTIIHGALWHREGSLDLVAHVDSSHEGYSVIEGDSAPHASRNVEQVKAYTVDKIRSDLALHAFDIDILKIDIGGAEACVFCQGDNEWLKRVNVIIMEMPDNDCPGSFQLIMETISSLGIRGKSHIYGENFVFCKDGSGFELRPVVGIGQ